MIIKTTSCPWIISIYSALFFIKLVWKPCSVWKKSSYRHRILSIFTNESCLTVYNNREAQYQNRDRVRDFSVTIYGIYLSPLQCTNQAHRAALFYFRLLYFQLCSHHCTMWWRKLCIISVTKWPYCDGNNVLCYIRSSLLYIWPLKYSSRTPEDPKMHAVRNLR